jgi:glycosyltransferase involved in cell wall biosynthesis
MIKVSIITVCYNSEKTIEDTLKSVAKQTYHNIEHIVIDGNSTDSTNSIVERYAESVAIHVSEPDKGLYDAMNKGIKLATGDVIGILNSDDILFDNNTIQTIVESFGEHDGVYANIGFYNDDFTVKKRHYSSAGFNKNLFTRGFMPAHPSFYAKKSCYEALGDYNSSYKIAADFEMLIRMFNLPNSHFHYIDTEVVKMRIGGVSTSGLSSNILLNQEILRACRANSIPATWLSVLSKYPSKIMGYIFK